MTTHDGEQKLHLRSRIASRVMILIGMISVTMHASAQHLIEGAHVGLHSSQTIPRMMQSVGMSAAHGQYIASAASHSKEEPGAFGLVLGLTLCAMIFFTINGRRLFKPLYKAPVPDAAPAYIPDSTRLVETSSSPYPASHLSWNAPSTPQTVSSGN